ncbi:MAG: ASCH domain-containing protein [Acidilobaceae archaeon]|nr:ASCH domain-containing protein [Acidilobaceae archaeon]
MRWYLLSIKPRYAEALLSGEKELELRRADSISPPPPGSLVILYAGEKVRSIVGEFTVGRVYVGTPEEIWRLAERRGISRDAKAYIAGSRRAMAIEALRPIRYEKVGLEEIRELLPGWTPPRFGPLPEGHPVRELIIRPLRELAGAP